METKDKKLIEDYLEGNNVAFAELIELNLKLIYRYAFRMTRDIEDSEDITQETFVKLWKNIGKFDLDKNFRTWLLGIAHNTAIDFLRKKKDFVFSDFDNDAGNFSETIADTALLPTEIFAQVEKKKLLDDALGRLSPMSREILILYYESDLTFAEIGTILNKPLNTVKSQHRRALSLLRKIFTKMNAPK